MQIAMKVKDVMDRRVVSVGYTMTVVEPVKRLIENDVWSLVVDWKGAPWGVVNDSDILRRCLAKWLPTSKSSVGSISSSPLITIVP